MSAIFGAAISAAPLEDRPTESIRRSNAAKFDGQRVGLLRLGAPNEVDMRLEALVAAAAAHGASDLHIEPGLPVATRVDGRLQPSGVPVPPEGSLAIARAVVGDDWSDLDSRGSWDGARALGDTRCRIHVSRSGAGIGLSIRLLHRLERSFEQLNLHPDLARFAAGRHGLVIVSGPTGSGKTTTLAALVQEMNQGRVSDPPRHIVTLEAPVEYDLAPERAFIRQREVGRNTPSFEQGLLDAMRQDPDVLLVGEMRRPETMRLTLDAAETGHLVLATMHSATTTEALQRLVGAFAAESQAAVRMQLADCLVAVICQRLERLVQPDGTADLRAPVCEVLTATDGVRAIVRQGAFQKLATAIEAGRDGGMWTFDRYGRWLRARRDLHRPRSRAVRRPLPEWTPGATPIAAPIAPIAPAPAPRPAIRMPPPRISTGEVLEKIAPSVELANALAALERGD